MQNREKIIQFHKIFILFMFLFIMIIDGKKFDGRVRRRVLRQLDKMSLARKRGVVGYEIINGAVMPIYSDSNNGHYCRGMEDVIEELSSETPDFQPVYGACEE